MDNTHSIPLFLASASPRRRELLEQIGVAFECLPVDIDESRRPGEVPAEYVVRLALEKAQRGAFELSQRAELSQVAEFPERAVVLGADTVVVCGDEAFGKPSDAVEARCMLMSLSGRTHEVLTAVAVGTDGDWRHRLVTTEVTFRTLSEAECDAYWQTGEPADKAGGYAIQGFGAVFVHRISGSYSAVVGLPLMETAALLRETGIDYWKTEASRRA